VDISRLTDAELLARTKALAQAERAALCDLIEHLAEIDKRSLYKDCECASLFEYCVHALNCSEAAAYRRIRAARAVRIFPPITVLIRDGRLSLESVALLHPFLDRPDAASLIRRASGLRSWQVQAMIAGLQTEKPRRDVIRFTGEAAASSVATEPQSPLLAVAAAVAAPPEAKADSSPESETRIRSVRVSFTADADFYRLMQRARALLRHKYPDGRLEGVLKDALGALLAQKLGGFGWKAARRG
jgi:hypothetical protein